MPEESLQLDLSNIGIIRQKLNEFYQGTSRLQFPFVDRAALIYLIKSFQVDPKPTRSISSAMLSRFYSFLRRSSAENSDKVHQILTLCLGVIAETDNGIYNLYDLILLKLSNKTSASEQGFDPASLLNQSKDIQRLALDTLLAKYNDCIPSSILPNHVLPLLRQFSSDPFQFTAILLWCLQSGMTQQATIESGVLHYLLCESESRENQDVFGQLSIVYGLVSLFKETVNVGQFLEIANNTACGIREFPTHNIWGVDTKTLFTKQQLDVVTGYREGFATKKFMGSTVSIQLLYRVFKLPFACFLHDQLDGEVTSADRANVQSLIESLDLNDFDAFLAYIRTKLDDNKKLPHFIQIKCISRFQMFVTILEERIEKEIKIKGNFSYFVCSQIMDTWKILLSITKHFDALKLCQVWNYTDEYHIVAMMLQMCVECAETNGKAFNLDDYVEVLQQLSGEKNNLTDFLLHIALVTRCERLQEKIVASCKVTINTKFTNHETLFVTALKRSTHSLAKIILHATNPEEVKHTLLGKNNSKPMFFYRSNYNAGIFSILLKHIPESEHQNHLTSTDIDGDTVLHWLADDAEAISLLFPLIAKPVWIKLLQSTNKFKQTLLHLGAENTVLLKLCDDFVSTDDLLKEDKKKETVIHKAACCKAGLELLLPKFEKQEDVEKILNHKNKFGKNVIMLAVSNREALKYLCQFYSKESLSSMVDDAANSLLHLAADYTESFKFLYEYMEVSTHPEYLRHTNIFNRTVLQAALCNDELDMLELGKARAHRLPPMGKLILNGIIRRDDALPLDAPRGERPKVM